MCHRHVPLRLYLWPPFSHSETVTCDLDNVLRHIDHSDTASSSIYLKTGLILALATMRDGNRGQCWSSPALPYSWESWPCRSLDTTARELVPAQWSDGPHPSPQSRVNWLWGHACTVPEFTASPKVNGPVTDTDQLGYNPDPQPRLWLDTS